MRILSLGAGVQSTTMALMAAHGEIEPPDLAIFADTGAEPAPVYEHLRWLMSGNVLPFPVLIVQAGNIIADMTEGRNTTGHRFVSIPFHGVNVQGGEMMARRQCTEEYKLKPIRAKVRELLGAKRPRPGACTMLIGISTDEVARMKPSRVRYIRNEHPLIERGMRRWDCLRWMERNGYPLPPKSACTICPFRQNAEWRWLRDHDPAGWQQAVEIDHGLRQGKFGRWDGTLFLHRLRVPLDHADIRSDEERGQLDLWGNECEGICGI